MYQPHACTGKVHLVPTLFLNNYSSKSVNAEISHSNLPCPCCQMSSTSGPPNVADLMSAIRRARPIVPGGQSDTKSTYHSNVEEPKLSAVISRVTAVCSKSELVEEGVLHVGYHFRLFCVIDEDNSVELQTFRLSTSTGICRLLVIDRNYASSNKNQLDKHEMPCVEGREFTIKEVIDYILHVKKRYKYLFDCDTGSGCRYWCNVVVQDLEDFGLLPVGTTVAMVTWGDRVAETDREHMNIPATQGIFYDD